MNWIKNYIAWGEKKFKLPKTVINALDTEANDEWFDQHIRELSWILHGKNTDQENQS